MYLLKLYLSLSWIRKVHVILQLALVNNSRMEPSEATRMKIADFVFDLLYVFPCIILFLCFSVLLVLRLPRLGKRELSLVLFVRLFGLCLFRFVGFLFLLGSGKGCGL